LAAVNDSWREVVKEEHAFSKKKQAFEEEYNKVTIKNDQLQEELDRYCLEKEQFDREAQAVKEKGEQDQIESEKVGYFKANKERLRDELKKLRADLDSQRQLLREDKIKLELFKTELNTKQKTIESLRYNYIKAN
jgi:chromosome segregation ATPase